MSKKAHYSVATHNYPEPIPGTVDADVYGNDGMANLLNFVQEESTLLNGFPQICYYANNSILELEECIHTPDAIDVLNRYGVHIFLYEPLCMYVDGQDPDKYDRLHNFGFYSEFTGREDPDTIRAQELDSIKLYVENNDLDNVIVHTCDYDAADHLPYYTNMTLLCDDWFLKQLTYNVPALMGLPKKENITAPVISTNWRFSPVRCLISSAVSLDPRNHLSWVFRCKPQQLSKTVWIDYLDHTTLKGLWNLNLTVPATLDLTCEQATDIIHFNPVFPETVSSYSMDNNPVTDNQQHMSLGEYYRTSLVDVVCESRYAQPTANLSEKVFQAMQYRTPFLLVAPPHSLRYLKELGYKTFSDWWDEGYDSIEDHAVRLQAIISIIDDIQCWDEEKRKDIYQQMSVILAYNFRHMLETSRTWIWDEPDFPETYQFFPAESKDHTDQ